MKLNLWIGWHFKIQGPKFKYTYVFFLCLLCFSFLLCSVKIFYNSSLNINLGYFKKYNEAAKYLHCTEQFWIQKNLTDSQWKIQKCPVNTQLGTLARNIFGIRSDSFFYMTRICYTIIWFYRLDLDKSERIFLDYLVDLTTQ